MRSDRDSFALRQAGMIPTGTDAPLYHRPIVTVGLILTNVAAFVVAGLPSASSIGAWDGLLLSFGEGLRPLEWLTYNFVHFGAGHLIGNMVFLWVFGLVVEGKVGWARFLAAYLGIGALGGFIMQVAMLSYGGITVGAGGASLVVFGLIALCVLWAPENEVSMVSFWYWGRIFIEYEVRIWVLGGFYGLFELLMYSLSSQKIGGHGGHLIGAALGAGVGYWMLKHDLVDCEGWDLLTLLKRGKPRTEVILNCDVRNEAYLALHTRRRGEWSGLRRPKNMEQPFVEAVTAGNMLQAEETHGQFTTFRPQPTQRLRQLEKRLCQFLIADGEFQTAAKHIRTFVDRYPDRCSKQRLCLAVILIDHLERPKAGLRELQRLRAGELDDKQQPAVRRLKRRAERMVETGVLEIAGP